MTRQLNRSAADGHAGCARVKNEGATPKLGMGKSAGAADQSANAGQDLFDPERLSHVVVRPAVDPLYLFMPTSPRGQNEHRRENARLPPTAEQGESVNFRQSQVEHDGVISLSVREEIGMFPIGGA